MGQASPPADTREEARPRAFSVAQVEMRPVVAGNPYQKPRDPSATAGADLKYALTPGLTLTATINPDLGQVRPW